MYSGRFEHRLDAKGRIQVPMAVRRTEVNRNGDRFAFTFKILGESIKDVFRKIRT